MPVSDLRDALLSLGLNGRPICLHSSMRSFAPVKVDADLLIDVILAQNCTIMVPSFSYYHAIVPPSDMVIAGNGWGDAGRPTNLSYVPVYDPLSRKLSLPEMGTLPRRILERQGHKRGAHPINSFAALGPKAEALVLDQTPEDVYAPLRNLIDDDGAILLIGVGMTSLTLGHLAEKQSGRELFVRWALDRQGEIIATRTGGCSNGFDQLAPHVEDLSRSVRVGSSRWTYLPARTTLTRLVRIIKRFPELTHCKNPDCARCNDAALGGPAVHSFEA